MNLEEAKKKMKLSEEEIASLEHYTGFEHTRINLLCNMDPDVIEKLSKQGWAMLETKEELKTYIDRFTNIYSAMYKNSKSGYHPTRLVRGTGISDVERLRGVANQFLSTTRSMDVAKTFAHVGESAIIYLDLEDDVPAIDMDKYHSEYARSEEEVLIAPFCRVVENNFYSKWDGYTFYNVKIAKPELKEKSQEDIDSLQDKVINSFENNLKLIDEYKHLKDDIDLINERLQVGTVTGADKEYIKHYEDELFAKREKFFEVTNNINDYKNSLRGLLEGKCRQKEIEIDKAKDTIDKQKVKEQEDTKKRIDEEIRLGQIGETNNHITRAINHSNELGMSLDTIYEDLLKTDENSIMMAESLGIPYKSRSEISEIGKKIEGIKEVLSQSEDNANRQRLDAQDKSISKEDAIEKDDEVSEYSSSIIEAKRLVQSIESYGEEFGDEEFLNIKEEVYKKAMSLIKEAKTAKLNGQKEEIQGRKVGFFGKLLGKEKLRQAELKNVELKIEAENNKKPDLRFNDFSVRTTLATIYNAREELGEDSSKTLTDFYNKIKENFALGNGSFDDEKIAQIAKDLEGKNLPIAYDPKEKTKDKIQRIQEENQRLEAANKEEVEEQETDERESSITDMLKSLSVVRECLTANPYSKDSMKEKNKQRAKDMDEQDKTQEMDDEKIREALESQFK